jgi:hypothetical protein
MALLSLPPLPLLLPRNSDRAGAEAKRILRLVHNDLKAPGRFSAGGASVRAPGRRAGSRRVSDATTTGFNDGLGDRLRLTASRDT